MKLVMLMLFALTTALVARADESFRCGRWIVSSDLTVAELLQRCGAPTSKQVTQQDVMGPRAGGRGRIKVGVVIHEVWRYERGPQAFPMIITIEDGRIRGIVSEK